MQNKKNNQAGYTIIETMIAISVFVIVIMIGMASLLNANVIHKKSQDMRSIMDNLSFIMDDISRNLRTGSNYYCITGGDTLSNVSTPKSGQSCWGIAFETSTGDIANPNDQWVYYVNNTGKVFRSTQGPYTTINSFVQLTPNEVAVTGNVGGVQVSGFSVLGAETPDNGDLQQPFSIIKLTGNINYKNIITPFSLQASVSQRLVDRIVTP